MHLRWRWVLGAFTVGVVAATIVVIGVRGGALKQDRRAATNARITTNATEIARVDALVDANRDRTRDIAALTRANTALVLRLCRVQNDASRSTNAIIAYFEVISKQVDPGPATDRFWAGVPRPVVKRCTPPGRALPSAP